PVARFGVAGRTAWLPLGTLDLGRLWTRLFQVVWSWLIAFGGALGARPRRSAVLRSQIVSQRRGRLLARRVVFAHEAFDPEQSARGLREALRRLVTDGAIGRESLRRALVPAQGFLGRGTVDQPHRRNADRQPGDALA